MTKTYYDIDAVNKLLEEVLKIIIFQSNFDNFLSSKRKKKI